MSQVVTPVPNPNFSTKALVTVAPTIVSRRQIKVPCNNVGTYGPNRGTLPSEVVFDIADNESFIDLANVILSLDITPSWSSDYLSPLLEIGTSGLIARLTIGTSQGLKIEEIQNYSQLASIIQLYSIDKDRKEMSLLDGTNFSTEIDKNRGDCTFFDSPGVYKGNCYLTSGVAQRLHIRFHHSSFMNNIRYLPLFLLKNGLRIQVEFENVYKAFTYSISPTIQSMEKIPQTTVAPTYSSATLSTGSGIVEWFMTKGTQNLGGTTLTPVEAGGSTTIWEPNLSSVLHKTNSAYGMRAIHAIWFPQHLAQSIFSKLIGRIATDTTGFGANNTEQYDVQHCVPIFIRENGYNVFYGLITASAYDYTTIDFSGANSNMKNDSLRVDSFATPTQFTTPTILTTAREFTYSTKRFTYYTVATAITGKSIWIPFNIEVPADTTGYYRSFTTSDRFDLQFKYMSNRGVELLIDWNSKFTVPNNTTRGDTLATNYPVVKSIRHLPIHPAIAAKLNSGIKTTGWDYEVKNIELLMDLCKPSADVFANYLQAFEKPEGIPIAYKKVLYQSKELGATSAGQVSFTLPFAVRSMLGCVIAITDQITGQDTTDWTKTTFPILTSFLRRGLTRAELVIGGQVFPAYPLIIRKTSDDSENTLAQVVELERFFGVKNTASFFPSFAEDKLRDVRNYFMCGSFDKTASNLDDTTASSLALNQYEATSRENTALSTYSSVTVGNTPSIFDSSKAIWGWSTSKDDVQSFATGIDTSQSGTVHINLYFDDSDPWEWIQRSARVHIYVFCDAVCTFQSTANLVRS